MMPQNSDAKLIKTPTTRTKKKPQPISPDEISKPTLISSGDSASALVNCVHQLPTCEDSPAMKIEIVVPSIIPAKKATINKKTGLYGGLRISWHKSIAGTNYF